MGKLDSSQISHNAHFICMGINIEFCKCIISYSYTYRVETHTEFCKGLHQFQMRLELWAYYRLLLISTDASKYFLCILTRHGHAVACELTLWQIDKLTLLTTKTIPQYVWHSLHSLTVSTLHFICLILTNTSHWYSWQPSSHLNKETDLAYEVKWMQLLFFCMV